MAVVLRWVSHEEQNDRSLNLVLTIRPTDDVYNTTKANGTLARHSENLSRKKLLFLSVRLRHTAWLAVVDDVSRVITLPLSARFAAVATPPVCCPPTVRGVQFGRHDAVPARVSTRMSNPPRAAAANSLVASDQIRSNEVSNAIRKTTTSSISQLTNKIFFGVKTN